MLHTETHTDARTPLVVTKTTTQGYKYLRMCKKVGQKPLGRTIFQSKDGKGKAKKGGGIVHAFLPHNLYKQAVLASNVSGRSMSDIVRAGVIREVGAIAMASELRHDLDLFNCGQPKRQPARDVPAKEPKINKAKVKSLLKALGIK